MKKTIEEVAEEYAMYNYDSSYFDITDHFIAGAKYQSEQMYSEEEVREMSLKFICYWYDSKGNNTEQIFDKWFNQFKKK